MGMSASQARLLYLTAQLNNLSLKGQMVSDAKVRLSMDTEEIQQKYIKALNSTRLFVSDNIFTANGAVTKNEYISLDNLKAQGLMVSNGTSVLGYSYQQVATGEKETILAGWEDDLSKPIYPTKKVPASGFQDPSASAAGSISKMTGIVNQLGLSENNLAVQSYTTVINGEEVELNSIAIKSQAGFEAIVKLMSEEAQAGKIDNSLQQNYVLDMETIDMSGATSYGIPFFQGVFDGNGATIKNLHGEQGLFRDVYGVVKSVNIDGADIAAESDAIGAIAGYLGDGGLIENCNVKNANITCNLKNQTYENGYDSERAGVGAIVGYNQGSIKNTSAQGIINVPNADESFGYIGGFIGANINPAYGDVDNVIENCYSDVDIKLGTGKDYSNSINAFIGDDTYESEIKNCISIGSITTINGENINGKDLANWGPVIESNITNMMALDTRNNSEILYWSNTENPSFGNGSKFQPDSFRDAMYTLPDGSEVPVWLNPGTEGYNKQNQVNGTNNELPVLNLSAMQNAALVSDTEKEVPDTEAEPIGYQQKPIYEEVDIYKTELVEDPSYSISTNELEQGLRSGAFQLVKQAGAESTQTVSLNGLFYEVVSLNTCSTVIDKAEDEAAQKAEAEYNKGMQEIQAKDKRYELDQKKIDTEYNACLSEEESIKSVLNKNVERSFKTFG